MPQPENNGLTLFLTVSTKDEAVLSRWRMFLEAVKSPQQLFLEGQQKAQFPAMAQQWSVNVDGNFNATPGAPGAERCRFASEHSRFGFPRTHKKSPKILPDAPSSLFPWPLARQGK